MQFATLSTFHKYCGKSNKQIADEIISFVNQEPIKIHKYANTDVLDNESARNIRNGYLQPEFIGYYCDYDWVLLCSLFGRMIDLPKGFPMYCIDLKQNIDENIKELSNDYFTIRFGVKFNSLKGNFLDEKLHLIKDCKEYPKQTNEHNALADARWNFELYKFIQQL
jgi:hypothetical protein